MAIPSYSTPAEAGLLIFILVNMAISLSIIKGFFLSILRAIGIRIKSWEEVARVDTSNPSPETRRKFSKSYIKEFRSQIPAMRYGSISTHDKDCSICLSEFERNAEVNRLSCGHVFHKTCLEEWLTYWKTKCPLCRKYVMSKEVEAEEAAAAAACPM